MRTLYLCGAGNSEGVRLALTINRRQPRWDRIALLDDDPRKLGEVRLGVEVAGPLDLLRCPGADETVEAANLVARTTAGRRAVRERIVESGAPFAPLVAADVDVEGAALAPDVIVYQHATIGPEVEIGDGACVFMGAVVGHESRVGAGCVIAANAVINARVTLGEGVYVGSCATIVPEVRVGAWATIGAGSLVVQDVPDGATVVGVPAEMVQRDVASAPADGLSGAAPPLRDEREIEASIMNVWREVLVLPDVQRDDNFFDLGGRSLQALQLRERIRQATGCELALTDVFRFPSVRTLAEHLGRSQLARDCGTAIPAWARRAAVRRSIRSVMQV